MQDSLPAGGLRLYREGVEPSGSLRGVSGYIHSPLQNLPVARVIYAKPPFAGPKQVLTYVGRYTHRIAISNSRLLAIDDGQVRFRWKDYRHDSHHGAMTLAADEFIRRFLIHVLPDGFHRIRYFGFLCNRQRERKLARCRELLGMTPTEPAAAVPSPPDDYRTLHEALTGTSLTQCPACGQGHMLVVEVFPQTAKRRWDCDTS